MRRNVVVCGKTSVITDPIFYALALPAVMFLGLSKGGFAGVGTAATPLLAIYLPPLQAAALLLPIMICQDAISVWVYRRDWDPWNVKVILAGAIIGLGLAWAFAAYVSDNAIRLLVGLIGITFTLNAWFGRAPVATRPPRVRAGLFWGAAAGFASMLIQGGGPPFQMFVLPQRMAKLTLVGTTTVIFTVINALKIVPYFALGQLSTETIGTSAVLLPIAVVTNLIGIWLVRVTPTELFYRIAYWLVLFISLALIWQASAPIR